MPQRRALVARLVADLRRQCDGIDIVNREHVDGDSPSVDFPAVIQAACERNRTWLLLLEDDAILAPVFGSQALDAINQDAEAVSLFSRRKVDLEAMDRGIRYRKQAASSYSSTVAILMRTECVAGMPIWSPSWYASHPQHLHASDLLLADWMRLHGYRIIVRVPSLVQHLGVTSTLPSRGGKRQSESYRRAFGEVDGY
jgi:hypothetical protein